MFRNIGKIQAYLAKSTPGKPPRIKAADDSLDVWIYGPIGGYWDGVDALATNQAIAEFEGKEITVHVNSEGGDVFAGIAITNALQSADAKIVTVNEGLAASAASVIMQAGDQRIMMPSTRMMIHRAWTVSAGNANDMRETADILESIDADLISLYAARSGGSSDDITGLLDAETWFSADESVDSGFADAVGMDDPPAENRTNMGNLMARVRLKALLTGSTSSA